jgi:hypothetical protein
MCLPNSLGMLHVCNINMEFSKVFTRKFEHLSKLELSNVTRRKKLFDETELKAMVFMAASVTELVLDNTPVDDVSLNTLFQQLKHLKKLKLMNASHLGNATLHSIAKHCPKLYHITLGGSSIEYNLKFTKEGFEFLSHSNMPLEEFCLQYVAKVGDSVLSIIAKKYQATLKSMRIPRFRD